MRNDSVVRHIDRLRVPLALTLLLAMFVVIAPQAATAGTSGPSFTKVFEPDTIGPGSTSTLTFTIVNTAVETLDEMTFTDVLPTEIKIAAPAAVDNDCAGIVSAPDGGGTISLTDGDLGLGETCTISVDVTASATDTNISGSLNWHPEGSAPGASATLTVDTSLPGFRKSFAPSTVEIGGRSVLTFTIDNSGNASAVPNLDFSDTLPPGMTVAGPANATTDCGTATLPPALTADPGSATIILDSNGTAGFPAVAAGASCTVEVDVIGGAIGSLGNVSDNLLAEFIPAGKASAVLEVTGVLDLLELSKEFIDDPVAPGGTAMLEFTVTNKSRTDSATGITFDDNLETTLTGLAPVGPLPTDPCGAGSSLAFSLGVLTLAGGTLPPEGSCTIGVQLTVPSDATPGTYPNTAGPVSGDVGGSGETGNVAGDLLFVVSFPVLTKEFTDDPVGTGSDVTLEFTITNPETTSTMSDIEFLDELTGGSGDVGSSNGFLPFPVSVTIPAGEPCGTGSSLSLVSVGEERQGLELLAGSLAAAGNPGDSCTFSVTVDIPADLASGTYTNTTEAITGVLDDFAGPPTVMGPSASDDILVVAAPTLTKEFTDDPVDSAGGTATLEFTLTHEDTAPGDATAIAFTDDLTALVPAIAGLVAASVDTNTCSGATVDISTPTSINYSGGTLTPGESCAVSVSLTVPAGASSGAHTNTTSEVTATVLGVTATGNEASDDLQIATLTLAKQFVGGAVIPGAEVTLSFTLDNQGAADATAITFTDSLAAILPGTPDVTVTTALPVSVCGGTLDGNSTFLFLTGGSVAAGTDCSFDVTVLVPAAAADGDYLNVTSGVSSSLGTSDPAVALLSIESTLLELTKEFTDDPVAPGDTVTLEFVVTNLSATETITGIAFDDDLDAALTGMVATAGLSNDCGGMVGFPVSTFVFPGDTLAPSASCTIRLEVTVPPGPLPGNVFANTTSGVTGKVGLLDVFGEAASDDLKVQTVTFAKSFDGPTTATGTAVLTFTIENVDSVNPVDALAFSDDLDAILSGLVASGLPTTPCGAGSLLAGSSFLTLTGGNLGASGTCSFDVTVSVPVTATAGTFVNTTSDLFSFGLPLADPATADLTIEPPPAFSKAFAPDTVFVDEVSTLTFTIDNSAGTFTATSLDFTDNLPAGVEIASPSGAATTCTGGTLTAVAGSGVVTYTGGSVAGGASCTVTVDVTATSAGASINTTGDLTSSSGNSGTATDTLTVDPAEADISITKDDGVTTAVPGHDTLTYTIVVANAGPSDDPDVAVDDTFPTELTCSWTSVAAGGATGNSSSSGASLGDSLAMPNGSSVTYTVTCTIDPAATGTVLNTATADASITDPDTNNNSATDTTTLTPEADISVTKDDGRTTAVPGQDTIAYTIVVTNDGPSDAPDVMVTDAFPSVLTCSWTSTASGGASGNTASGSGDLAETLAMPPGSSVTYTTSCSIDPAATGTLSNTATASIGTPMIGFRGAPAGSPVTDPDTNNNSATDTTTLTPEADISITKDDGLTKAVPGETTIAYTIVVANDGPSSVPEVTVADAFPSALTCSWTSTASSGASGNTASGSGDLAETLAMPPGSSVTYTTSCSIDPAATGTLSNSATAAIAGAVNGGITSLDPRLTEAVAATVVDPDPSNNSATDDDTELTPEADISITKTDGVTAAVAGQDTIVYTIVVSNAGPSTDPAVEVTDKFPPVLTCTWTSTSAGGASGNPGAGSGDIVQTLSMPPNSSVTFTASCTADPTAAGNLTNTAKATGSVTDPNPSNGSANDNNTQLSPLVPAPEIPRTGSDSLQLARNALLVAFGGLMLVVISRNRRRRASTH